MEGATVVEAGSAEGEEVLGCLGDGLAEYLDFEVAFGGMQLSRESAHCCLEACSVHSTGWEGDSQ